MVLDVVPEALSRAAPGLARAGEVAGEVATRVGSADGTCTGSLVLQRAVRGVADVVAGRCADGARDLDAIARALLAAAAAYTAAEEAAARHRLTGGPLP